MIKIKSGIGYDIHRIKEGKGLKIGGVQVSDSLAADAHSDGDILIHAIIDSLLGAMGEPDIGELFPDTDPAWKGIDSAILLDKVRSRLVEKHFEIISIDCVVVARAPKIALFKKAMCLRLAEILRIPEEDINVKGKTKENVDSVGRGEAIECYAISMIRLIK